MDREVVSHARNGIISVATLVRLCDLAQREAMVSLARVRVGVRSRMWKSVELPKATYVPTAQVSSNYRLHAATTCFFFNGIQLVFKVREAEKGSWD